jgi:hypothetical protein
MEFREGQSLLHCRRMCFENTLHGFMVNAAAKRAVDDGGYLIVV